jgi:hypothetical protein
MATTNGRLAPEELELLDELELELELDDDELELLDELELEDEELLEDDELLGKPDDVLPPPQPARVIDAKAIASQ